MGARKKKRGPTRREIRIPSDLWDQILSRLPARTLLRFRCACRTWRSIIDNSAFALTHINQFQHNRDRSRLLMLHRDQWCYGNFRDGFIRRCDTFRKVDEIDIMFPFHCVYGSVNGLFLVMSSGPRWQQLVLWNPSIRKSVALPVSPFVLPRRKYGLGYDCCNDDYKVVVMETGSDPEDDSDTEDDSDDEEDDDDGDIVRSRVRVQVFSLKTGSWKSVYDDKWNFEAWGNGVYLEGFVHWIGCDRSSGSSWNRKGRRLVSFEVSTELFDYTTKLPELGHESLCVFDGCLALLDNGPYVKGIDTWVMEKYGDAGSWTKRFNIEYCNSSDLLNMGHEVIFCTKDGVKSYNVTSKQTKDLAKTTPKYYFFKDIFIESLVLLGTSDAFPSRCHRRAFKEV